MNQQLLTYLLCTHYNKALLITITLVLVYFLSEASDTIYLNTRMMEVDQPDSAVYFRVTQRTDSIPALANQKTFSRNMDLVMDINFLVKPLDESGLPPKPAPSENDAEIKSFSRRIDNEYWVHHGRFQIWYGNGIIKRHDIYNNGELVQGRIWNEDGTEAKYQPYFIDASFPGGLEGLSIFLQSNLRYPKRARRHGAQGVVVVSFVVERNGRLSEIAVLQSVHPQLDKEALRVVKLMPRWEHGLIDGEPARLEFFLPVRFVLN